MNDNLSHTSWKCKQHIVFAPKYRRKNIYGVLKSDYEQPEVRIKYFVPDEHKSGGAIVEVSGKVKEISATNGTIVMADGCKIRLSDIIDLSIG